MRVFFIQNSLFGCYNFSSVISKRKFLKSLLSYFRLMLHKITEGNMILDHHVSKLCADLFLTFHKVHNKAVYKAIINNNRPSF